MYLRSDSQKAIQELVRNDSEYRSIPWDAAEMIRLFGNLTFEYAKREENVDMCKTLEDWAAESEEKGDFSICAFKPENEQELTQSAISKYGTTDIYN